MVSLEELPAHLAAIAPEDWSRLFDLLDEIRPDNIKPPAKGVTYIKGKRATRFYSVPASPVDPVQIRFQQIVVALDIAPVFDWAASPEAQILRNNTGQDYAKLDVVTLCKLITVMIRADRFAEGYLAGCFEEGIVYGIVDALRQRLAL